MADRSVCCKQSVRTWLRIFNILEALFGLGFLVFGIYMAIKVPCMLAYLIIALGGSMLLVSLVGYAAVAGRSPRVLTIYSTLLCLLLLIHTTLVILTFAEQQMILHWIDSNNGNSKDFQDVEAFLKEHTNALGALSVCVCSVELVSFLISLLRSHVLVDAQEDWDNAVRLRGSSSSSSSSSARARLLEGQSAAQRGSAPRLLEGQSAPMRASAGTSQPMASTSQSRRALYTQSSYV